MNIIQNMRESGKSYLSFKTEDELFAAHVAQVNNITEIPHITDIRDTPDFIKRLSTLGKS